MDTNGAPPGDGVDLAGQPQDRVITTSEEMLPPLGMTDFLTPSIGKQHEMVGADMGVFSATSALFDDSPPPQPQPQNGNMSHEQLPLPETPIQNVESVQNGPTAPNASSTNPQMSNEDLYYLQSKGAFDLPERSTQEELVFLYFSFVHPFLPLIDEPAFWADYNKNLESNFSNF
ncbi:hypothetical protein GP486_008535, partial [Trichoglossum hirsutum]